MNPHPHPIPTEWLSAYSDGELEALRRAQVEAHLHTCALCQQELAALKALSQALAADPLADQALTTPPAFWRAVEARLPDQTTASFGAVNVNPQDLLARWLPGIGLLLMNGLVQLGLAAGAVVVVLASWLPTTSPGLAYARRLADELALGWVGWVLPNQWSGLGLFVMFIVISTSLAVIYLAWLGYELRYGKYGLGRAAA